MLMLQLDQWPSGWVLDVARCADYAVNEIEKPTREFEEALETCREIGFTEDEWCHDVRNGFVRLDTLTAQTVTFVSEQGTPLPMGDAADLLDAYQNGSIHPVEDEP